MPTATATATMTAPSVISLKPSPTSIPPAAPSSSSSSSSAAATLRSLYPRAARAFLQRDVALTHSLLTSALSLVQPPTSITFETTLYASPPPMQDPESLPPTLRANLMLTPEPLIATLHARSLQLYTPTDPPKSRHPGHPCLASLKLDCPEVGRNMIEDWLAKHGQESDADDSNGYSKVLELYCLHVLPRLQDWAELPHDVRQQLIASLRQLRTEAVSASRVQAAHHCEHRDLPHRDAADGRARAPRAGKTRRAPLTRTGMLTCGRLSGPPATESGTRPPSTLALLRASLASVLQNTSRSRVLLYAVLFVVVPVVSFVLRLRRRRAGPGRAITAGNASSTGSAGGRAVDAGSVLGSLWGEVARAVLDTVRMAGRGLV
ncbi:hypothetical protein C8Q80DRAFT_1214867 [Daedaleopsis nitida]|nr:hypothetical protein C8Q80DRAFT_1214867 [Daedaleopsis nitida]